MRGFPKPCPPPHAASVVIHAVGTDVDYAEHAAPLSVKSVVRGVEVHEVGDVRYALDERGYLVLNDGQRYASHIRSKSPVEILTVFFDARLAREVGESLTAPAAVLLDKPEGHGTGPMRLIEHLYPHDDAVTPVLHAIHLAVRKGVAPLVWFDEQLHVLLDRLLELQRGFDPEVGRLPALRHSTRVEIYRRLSRARDFIEASLADPIGLAEMAQVACLSRHHFLRVFRQAFGVTPHQHLTNRRLDRARELLAQTETPVREVCLAVGFESLGSFSHSFRRRFGISPRGLRRAARDSTGAGSGAGQPWGRENGS